MLNKRDGLQLATCSALASRTFFVDGDLVAYFYLPVSDEYTNAQSEPEIGQARVSKQIGTGYRA